MSDSPPPNLTFFFLQRGNSFTNKPVRGDRNYVGLAALKRAEYPLKPLRCPSLAMLARPRERNPSAIRLAMLIPLILGGYSRHLNQSIIISLSPWKGCKLHRHGVVTAATQCAPFIPWAAAQLMHMHRPIPPPITFNSHSHLMASWPLAPWPTSAAVQEHLYDVGSLE